MIGLPERQSSMIFYHRNAATDNSGKIYIPPALIHYLRNNYSGAKYKCTYESGSSATGSTDRAQSLINKRKSRSYDLLLI
jgi:hypothetical protein